VSTTDAGSLRAVVGFQSYALGRVVAWTGHALSLAALPVLVYQRTGSSVLTGLLAAAESVPYLLLGLVVGALVDRRDGRRVLVTATVVSAVAVLTVPAADVLGVLSTAQLLVVAFVVGVTFVFADAASFGVLPRLVGRDRVGAATAALSAASTVVAIAGPAVAGVLIATVGAPVVIGIDGVLRLAAAGLLLTVPWSDRDRLAARAPTLLRADIAEGLRFVWRHPVIRPLTILGFGNSFTGGAVLGLLVVVAVERMGVPEDDGRLGLLYVASAVGALVGSLLIGRLQRRFPVGVITLVGFALTTVIVVGWGTATSWVLGLLLLVLADLVDSVVILNGIVVRQTLTPMRLQGRVNTTARVIAWGGAPLGAVVGGVLAAAWGVDVALYACAGAVAASLLVGVRSGLGRVGRLADLERPPDAPDGT
jgi:MFS family permease